LHAPEAFGSCNNRSEAENCYVSLEEGGRGVEGSGFKIIYVSYNINHKNLRTGAELVAA